MIQESEKKIFSFDNLYLYVFGYEEYSSNIDLISNVISNL